MHRRGITLTVLSILTGAAAFFLRKRELNTIFDEATGLAQKNAPITLALAGLVLVMILVALIIAATFKAEDGSKISYGSAFGGKSMIWLVIAFLMCMGQMFASVAYCLSSGFKSMSVFEMVFAALGVLGGIAYLMTAVFAFKGNGEGACGFFSSLLAIFFAVWMVISFRDRAADPVIIDYVYKCLALGASALAMCSGAGFAFGNNKTRRTLWFSFAAVVLSCVALADDLELYEQIWLICALLANMINMGMLSRREWTKSSTAQE